VKYYFIIITTCLAVHANAQLNNTGFEQHSSLPMNMGQWQVVSGWGNAGSVISSPDYYHYDGAEAADIPETAMAIVDAYEGQGIMGLVACGKSLTNTREYLSTQFAVPLQLGKQYVLSFKMTNGDRTATSHAGLGVDKLGILLGTSPAVQTGQEPILMTPQLQLEEVFYSREWESVNFLFVANEAYTSMTFGLFGNDDDKNIVIGEGVDPQFAYVFLDDFYIQQVADDFDPNAQEPEKGEHETGGGSSTPPVLTGDLLQDFFIPNTFTPNGDGDNDIFKPVGNLIKEWEFAIFTKWGERVFFTADEIRGWDGTHKTLNCENGSYVWQVTYVKYNDQDEPQRVEKRGIVNLVR
jgi:gliding motility-associated-like protein